MSEQAHAGEHAPALLERGGEILRIEETVQAAADGTGALLLIEGPAGIGKTELLTAAIDAARDRGMAWARARGSELERELAFGVVRQLLEPALARADAALRAELNSGAAALARPLFTPAVPRTTPPDTQTFDILHGLHWTCATLAQAAPLLLAVDDAHWADLASLRFLAYLAPRLDGLPLALVVTTRQTESPAEEELLVRLAVDARAGTLTPAPLSPAAVAAMLRTEFGREPEPAFVTTCATATGGTPFLVRELIRELRGEGVEPVAAAAARVAPLGPRTIARAVVARVRSLGDGALEIARAASVLGSDAQLPVVAALAGTEPSTAVGTLDALDRAGVVSSARPVEFVHPIVRHSVYADIPAGERGRMHARAAALLAGEGVAGERVASHLLAAQPAGDPHTVELLVRTAQAAMARSAPGSAAAYLERALIEPPAPNSRADVLHRLGVARIRAGDLAQGARHLEQAGRLAGEDRQRLAIARDAAAGAFLRWDHLGVARVIERVLDETDGTDSDLVLGLEADLLLMASLEPGIRPRVERRLGRFARDVGGSSPGVRKYLAARATDALIRIRPAGEVRALAARARQAGVVEELGSGATGWTSVLYPLICADGFDLAEQMLAEASEERRLQASLIASNRVFAVRSLLHLRQGAVREAVANAGTAVATGREASFNVWLIAVHVLLDALTHMGDTEAGEAALDQTRMAGELADTFLHIRILESRGRLRLAQGRVPEAIADLELVHRRCLDRGHLNPALFEYRSDLVLALLRNGDRQCARELAGENHELAHRWDAPRALGIALRTLGLCEGDLDLLEQSVAALDGSGAQLEHARSLVELGAAIRRAGRPTTAREPLRAGMALAHECGSPPVVARAREELVATGARPRRAGRTGLDALTPTELRIARMAASGQTNREIAQEMFVTTRTVEGHLTQVFRKLGVSSRGALAQRVTG